MKLTRENGLKQLGQKVMNLSYVGSDVVQCAQRFANSEEFQAVMDFLSIYKIDPLVSTLLDIGAGNGIASWAFAKSGFAVEALEPNPSPLVGHGAIEKLTSVTGISIRIHKTWGEALPVCDNSFNIVYCRSVLHHAHDLVQMLREIRRVLRPSGILLVCREHVISKPEDLTAFLSRHPMHQFTAEENAYLLQEYLSAFQCAGLDILRVLRPLESVINFYPMTCEELGNMITTFAQSLLGPSVGGMLSKTHLFQNVYVRWRDFRDNTPGRLFTFICRKPEMAGDKCKPVSGSKT